MIQLYIDAAFRPNTHECGIGIIIHDEKEHQVQHKLYISHVIDNHQAEFIALWLGLKVIDAERLKDDFILIFSDSQIVVDSIEKRYVKQEIYKGWLQLILQELAATKDFFIKRSHEKNNRGVDQIAKQALNKQGKVKELEI